MDDTGSLLVNANCKAHFSHKGYTMRAHKYPKCLIPWNMRHLNFLADCFDLDQAKLACDPSRHWVNFQSFAYDTYPHSHSHSHSHDPLPVEQEFLALRQLVLQLVQLNILSIINVKELRKDFASYDFSNLMFG
ncbi:hypothetical protein CFP56_033734 [Quercus suber]|uniref:Uncharacterized protein n=1 Tax=Quercus suber TaxID=58331 RepID=A0AAW0LTT9_QUESU